MDLLDVLRERSHEFSGSITSSSQLDVLRRAAGELPIWFFKGMSEYRLAGTCFKFPSRDDGTIGFGELMCWLDVGNILQECNRTNYFHSLLESGYLPVALGQYSKGETHIVIPDPLCITLSSPLDSPLTSVSAETGPDKEGDLVVVESLAGFLREAPVC